MIGDGQCGTYLELFLHRKKRDKDLGAKQSLVVDDHGRPVPTPTATRTATRRYSCPSSYVENGDVDIDPVARFDRDLPIPRPPPRRSRLSSATWGSSGVIIDGPASATKDLDNMFLNMTATSDPMSTPTPLSRHNHASRPALSPSEAAAVKDDPFWSLDNVRSVPRGKILSRTQGSNSSLPRDMNRGGAERLAKKGPTNATKNSDESEDNRADAHESRPLSCKESYPLQAKGGHGRASAGVYASKLEHPARRTAADESQGREQEDRDAKRPGDCESHRTEGQEKTRPRIHKFNFGSRRNTFPTADQQRPVPDRAQGGSKHGNVDLKPPKTSVGLMSRKDRDRNYVPRRSENPGQCSARAMKNARSLSPHQLSLGRALSTIGGLMLGDGAKLSAVGKRITSLDGVTPGVASRMTSLFLSNNDLCSLRGLECFGGVASLSLGGNLLRRVEDLRPLASLPRLETLSLEVNPVCGAPNYRAHVIASATRSLRVLDRREVTRAETEGAPAVVAAEKAVSDRIAREMCRLLLLSHMSGLFQCHAEFREGLTQSGGFGGAGGGRSGGKGRGPVWRQWSGTPAPVHQILAVLRPDEWPRFDRAELEYMERRSLDEAVELFDEVVARGRGRGLSATHELLEGAIATMGSQATRTWSRMLAEVQRRVQSTESDLLARCEGLRRREADGFRELPGQFSQYLQDLSKAVGHSDDQWALPSLAIAPQRTNRRHPRQKTLVQTPQVSADFSENLVQDRPGPETDSVAISERSCRAGALTNRRETQTREALAFDTDDATETARDRVRKKNDPGVDERGAAALTRKLSVHVSDGARRTLGASVPSRILPEKSTREPHPVEAELGRTYCKSAPPGLRRGRRDPSRTNSRTAPGEGGGVHEDEVPLRAEEPQGPRTPAGEPPPRRVKPEGLSAADVPSATRAEAGSEARGTSAKDRMPVGVREVPREMNVAKVGVRVGREPEREEMRAGVRQGEADTVGRAKAKRDRNRKPDYNRHVDAVPQPDSLGWNGVGLSSSPDRTLASLPASEVAFALSSRSAPEVGTRTHRKESQMNHSPDHECGSPRSASGLGPRVSARGIEGTPEFLVASAATATTCSVTGPPRPLTTGFYLSDTAEITVASSAREPGDTPAFPQAARGGSSSAKHLVERDGRESSIACERENTDRDNGAVGLAAAQVVDPRMTRGDTESDCNDIGRDSAKRLFQEAVRVKRLLAAADRADASLEEDDGIRDKDPTRFIASLGLVELKPLAPNVSDAIHLAPDDSFGDSSATAVDLRTTRALRDQVVALGKEVVRRAGGCAEARRLNVALRRQVEAARRSRSRNLDAVDLACRRLIAKAGSELQVMIECRRVAREATQYQATVTALQERIDATVAKARKAVSGSEAIARRLRVEMHDRARELAERRRSAEDGIEVRTFFDDLPSERVEQYPFGSAAKEWKRAAEEDPALRARRRAHDCELMLRRFVMGEPGGRPGRHRVELEAAWTRLRFRVRRQGRIRAWAAATRRRREIRLLRASFDTLALGGRLRNAEAAALASRSRAAILFWRREAMLSSIALGFERRRDREKVMGGLLRWRRSAIATRGRWVIGPGSGYGDTGGRDVDDGGSWGEGWGLHEKLEVFRWRRAARVVLRAWRDATRAGLLAGPEASVAAAAGLRGKGKAKRARGERKGSSGSGRRVSASRVGGFGGGGGGRQKVQDFRRGVQLRVAEAMVSRRRAERLALAALHRWRQVWRYRSLARTAVRRRALRRWKRRASEVLWAREAKAGARGRYTLKLGKRVLGAWAVAARARSRCGSGANVLLSILSALLKRRAYERWVSQTAVAALETDKAVTALEHSLNRCLRGHLRAWAGLARTRRVFKRGSELMAHGRQAAEVATRFRIWRRAVLIKREACLRGRMIAAWSAAGSRRRNRGILARHLAGWFLLVHRRVVLRSLVLRTAARWKRLCLSRGFRILSLPTLMGATAAASATKPAKSSSPIGDGGPADSFADGHGGTGGDDRLGQVSLARAVEDALRRKGALEGRVGILRAQLAHERARALERRSEAAKVIEEARREECERLRLAERHRHRERKKTSALAAMSTSGARSGVVGCKHPSSLPGSAGGQRGRGSSEGEPGRKERRRDGQHKGSGMGRKHGKARNEVESLVPLSADDRDGKSQLTATEGEVFGRLRAETIEMQHRARTAEKLQERARAEADRRAVAADAELEATRAECKRLDAGAKALEALRVQLASEAEDSATQAFDLSQRLAAAEQELAFEVSRNAERARDRDRTNTRLRATAEAARKRLVAARDTLRRKERDLEELLAKATRSGLTPGDFEHVSGDRWTVRGKGAADLEYRLFAATADARSAAQRCSTAARERRAAAGSALTEALREASKELGRADTARCREADLVHPGDKGSGGLADTRRFVREQVTEERRAVSGLELRCAEARLASHADRSLRSSLDCITSGLSKSLEGRPSVVGKSNANAPRAHLRQPARDGSRSRSGDRERPNRPEGFEPKGNRAPAGKNDKLAGASSATTAATATATTRFSIPSRLDKVKNNHREKKCPGLGYRRRQQVDPRCAEQQQPKTATGSGQSVALQELRQEISHLESKILGNLGGKDGNGDGRDVRERNGERGLLACNTVLDGAPDVDQDPARSSRTGV